MGLDLFKGSGGGVSSRKEPEAPLAKNYFFLYDNESPQIDLERYKTSQGKRYYVKLFISITTLQDIFIGSGEVDKETNQLVDIFSYITPEKGKKTWNIPGSSLKGCILSHLSMFLQPRSTDFFSAKDGPAKVFFADLPISSKSQAAHKSIPARFSPKGVPDNVRFKLYKKEYVKDTLPQGGYASEPGKEHIQAIPKGSQFSSFIHGKQLDEYEMAMLIVALGAFPGYTFQFKLGGAKNRGMGLVRLAIDFDKSFYALSLKDIVAQKVLPFSNLKPNLEKVLAQIRQDNPKLDTVIKKMQGEYGQ